MRSKQFLKILPATALFMSLQHPAPGESEINAGVGTRPMQLRVSPDGRHLQFVDGRPFFYLGDTVWELFHRLDLEESDQYLRNRAAKGFTVVQAVVLAEFEGLTVPNAQGDLPLIDMDPTKPNEAYFRHVDAVVDRANELGLVVGLLPTWGDKFNLRWGKGPEVFTPENAREYGRYLGLRYKDKALIWILGGDRNPEDEEDREIIRNMALGLHEGDGGVHLHTYHPMGGSTSVDLWPDTQWIDFHQMQSGHRKKDMPNYQMLEKMLAGDPGKPSMDAEPCYEDHPIAFKTENGYFTDFDSRRAGWWSMLSGACGHTYGNHNIWQLLDDGRSPVSAARTPWKQALDYPGAFQAGYMRAFFEQIDWQALAPAQERLLTGIDDAALAVRVSAAKDASLLVAYTPDGAKFTLNLEGFADGSRMEWFNPRQGTRINCGTITSSAQFEVDPPFDAERGNDWVLLIQGK